MKKLLLPLLLVVCMSANDVIAQELNFTVTVNSKQVGGTDQRVFESLQESIMTFLNNRIWTNLQLEENERIEGAIAITVQSREGNYINGQMNIALRRPVFNASITTPLFNYIDNGFSFEYVEGQQLDFNENMYMSNLTSLLAFYAYYCIGIYFDSFGLYGGDKFYEAAGKVVDAAQSSTEPGWKAFDSNKNRYWLLENMTNDAYKPLRQYYYEYHRLGLDVMGNGKVDEGRTAITKSLDCLKQAYSSKPNMYYLTILNDTKRGEWKSVYSEGPQQEKSKAVNILRDIDGSHAEEYEQLLNARK